MVKKKDCVEVANPSLARRTRFLLLAQRGFGRKYGHTVDALCGNPRCVCVEHVTYRPWKTFGKPTNWGEYAEKLAALKIGKSFEIADYPHHQTEISKLRGGIGANRVARLVKFSVRRLSGSTGVRITRIGTWSIKANGRMIQ